LIRQANINIAFFSQYHRTLQQQEQQQQQQQQQGKTSTTPAASTSPPGVLILSEAVSCSPALRGSFSVNPWQVQAVADTMAHAVTAEADDRTAWHEVFMLIRVTMPYHLIAQSDTMTRAPVQHSWCADISSACPAQSMMPHTLKSVFLSFRCRLVLFACVLRCCTAVLQPALKRRCLHGNFMETSGAR